MSIALVNSSIMLKTDNGKNGYNYYQWLRSCQKDLRPDLTLKEIWVKVSYANCTERSCKTFFSTSK
jgi:hypothetical protein